MNKVIHQDEDLTIQVGEPSEDAPIQMCEAHWGEVVRYQLTESEIENFVRVLFTLASRTLGTNTLMKYKCPVCGLKNFDYIAETILAVCPERKNGN